MNDINHKFYKLRWLREWAQQSETTRAILINALVNNASSSEKFDQNFDALIEFSAFEQSLLLKLKSFQTDSMDDYQFTQIVDLYRSRKIESKDRE